jgi:hypothetical protein
MEHFSRQDKRMLISSGRFDANGMQTQLSFGFQAKPGFVPFWVADG